MLRLSLTGGASRIVVVHDEVRRFVGMRDREVEPLTRDVSAAIPPLDLLARPEEGHVAIQGAAQGLIEADCHDDSEVRPRTRSAGANSSASVVFPAASGPSMATRTGRERWTASISPAIRSTRAARDMAKRAAGINRILGPQLG